ncbi:magnesium protoporphyrin IX methyltransferase [Variovorax sp. J22R133]|uniref:magnesium protoporphyrin IX methyltransferase n=1 Tax=Variovorax brevis TaxID=3053503 RepID=UPI0025764D07|nr:magnesium protoporphyrin IX methyltransferase [Variovorax sp. J22R133]MDM0113810.1 magnesium protoporphyrin IX methyltransferase [Variovorax sp. J22R133]
MAHVSYLERRGEIQTYFDSTAAQAWERLTSDAPVGRIRASVRAGRDRMRETLLAWLPSDLEGMRLLDAGCGTGALAVEAARRGADVIAIDLSPTLVQLARERHHRDNVVNPAPGSIDFRAGDMLEPALGRFDFIVGMDSLIHYPTDDAVRVIAALAQRADRSVLVTFAPSNAALAAMRAVGRFFPKANRAPWIEPVAQKSLFAQLAHEPLLAQWHPVRTQRIASGFYTSQALELARR